MHCHSYLIFLYFIGVKCNFRSCAAASSFAAVHFFVSYALNLIGKKNRVFPTPSMLPASMSSLLLLFLRDPNSNVPSSTDEWLKYEIVVIRDFSLSVGKGLEDYMLGVPTLRKISSDLAGWWIFRTIFHEDFKNVNFINVGHTPSTLNFCPRSPRTGSATGYVGRSLASTRFVWSKNQEGYFC